MGHPAWLLCIQGAFCPGGNRTWPLRGFWNQNQVLLRVWCTPDLPRLQPSESTAHRRTIHLSRSAIDRAATAVGASTIHTWPLSSYLMPVQTPHRAISTQIQTDAAHDFRVRSFPFCLKREHMVAAGCAGWACSSCAENYFSKGAGAAKDCERCDPAKKRFMCALAQFRSLRLARVCDSPTYAMCSAGPMSSSRLLSCSTFVASLCIMT